MAPIGTLWGLPHQTLTRIILTVAALHNLELELPEFNFKEKPAEFTSKFPYGKIPAFEGLDGFKLAEGVTIARYLNSLGTNANLLGSDAKQIALVDQWSHFAEQEIGVAAYSIMGTVYGLAGPFNREALDKHKERLVRALTHVESYLANRPSSYLVSDSVTLADIILAGVIHGCSQAILGVAERAMYPAIFSHLGKVTGDEKVKRFWGTEGFAEVAADGPRPYPY